MHVGIVLLIPKNLCILSRYCLALDDKKLPTDYGGFITAGILLLNVY